MKYLKKFESKTEEEDIRKFCEDNLAYLIDNGFSVDVNGYGSGSFIEYEIFIEKPIVFKWSDIKYDFIPFLELLDSKYKILNRGNKLKDFQFIMGGYDSYHFSKEMVLNDELETTTWLEYVKERGDNPGKYDKSDDYFLSTYPWRSINFYIKENNII